MKSRLAFASISVAALVSLTGCGAGVSAEDQAKQTAVAYMETNLGFDTETDISSFACEGTELRVTGDGVPASKPDAEGPDASITVLSTTQNDDDTWTVSTKYRMTSATPTANIIVSADGDCIIKGR